MVGIVGKDTWYNEDKGTKTSRSGQLTSNARDQQVESIKVSIMTTTQIKLNSCPCVIESVPNCENRSIVGCYELIEDDSRKGVLVAVENGSVVKESSTIDGGIFDLKICGDVFVATSNGYLRKYVQSDLKEISSIKLCDDFLTSLDVIPIKKDRHLIVSDSVGRIFIVSSNGDQFQLIQSDTVTKHETSIWRVKFVRRPDDGCGLILGLILVGSDDGSLRGFEIKEDFTFDTKFVLQNFDATAGVTAINSFTNTSNDSIMITGSYDEHLRMYKLDAKIPSLILLKTILIPGSGIWKIRVVKNHLLLAGMYSGVHEVDQEGNIISSKSFRDEESVEKKQSFRDEESVEKKQSFRDEESVEKKSFKHEESVEKKSFKHEESVEKKQLIYDVIENDDQLLIASFYKRVLVSIKR